jgi:hypothetical protein
MPWPDLHRASVVEDRANLCVATVCDIATPFVRSALKWPDFDGQFMDVAPVPAFREAT